MALGILTCFLILTGCGKSNDDTVWKSKEELVFGTTISTKSLDPAQGYSGWFTVRYGVAETLFKLDDAMEPIPWLAQGYEAFGNVITQIAGIQIYVTTALVSFVLFKFFMMLVDSYKNNK